MRELHPEGTTVEVVNFTDVHTKLPKGTRGKVENVDDNGTIHVQWDIGPRVGMIPGEDEWKIIKEDEE